MLKIDNNYLVEIKKAFLNLGFDDLEAEAQLRDLGKIIKMAILERLVLENPVKREQIIADPDLFIKDNFGGDYFENVTREVIRKTVSEYLDELTKSIDINKREQFLAHLDQASQMAIVVAE